MGSSVGRRMLNYRHAAGLDLEAASKKLGITEEALIDYEKDKVKIPGSLFLKMAEAYKFDVFEGSTRVTDGIEFVPDVSKYDVIKMHARYRTYKEFLEPRKYAIRYLEEQQNFHFNKVLKMGVDFLGKYHPEIIEDYNKDKDLIYHAL